MGEKRIYIIEGNDRGQFEVSWVFDILKKSASDKALSTGYDQQHITHFQLTGDLK